MKGFLDTNIIFHYSNYTNFSSSLVEKCYLFIKNKKTPFILCYAVLFELQNIIRDRSRLHKAVIEKIKDTSYLFENNPLVSFRNIGDAKKLYEKFKNYKLNEVEKIFEDQRISSEIKISKLLQFNIDEKVISLIQINNDLVNKIHDYINNHADCKILASALQFQKDKDLFLFVTADKDFAPNDYECLKEQFEINYSKEGWKFPELLNLIFTK